jgi:hypothetical protein
VSVKIGSTAAAGTIDYGSVQFTSDVSGSTSSVELATTANSVYQMILTPTHFEKSGQAGATITYTVTFQNTSNASETFDIALDGNSWVTNAPATVGPVAAGATAEFTVTVKVPGNAHAGMEDAVTVTLTSQQDPTQQASAILTTSAGRQSHFLPFILQK